MWPVSKGSCRKSKKVKLWIVKVKLSDLIHHSVIERRQSFRYSIKHLRDNSWWSFEELLKYLKPPIEM